MVTMEKIYSSLPRMYEFSSLSENHSIGSYSRRYNIGPVIEVHVLKFLDEYGLEVAIPSICKPGDTTYVVISRKTKRFLNEIHNHKAEVRSIKELFDNLQE